MSKTVPPIFLEALTRLSAFASADARDTPRLQSLTERVNHWVAANRDAALNPGQIDRIENLLSLFEEIGHRLIDSRFETPVERTALYEQIIAAEVELDYLVYPEVDPVVGWVHDQIPTAVDTQLCRYYFDRSLELLSEIDYKPLKTNITGRSFAEPAIFFRLGSESQIMPSTSICVPTITAHGALRVTKKTPGLLTVRGEYKSTFGEEITIIADYTFKAGVGAHLPNATTGFSCEYWLESPRPLSADTVLGMTFSVVFPSHVAESANIKPLMCVGGVSEKVYNGGEHTLLPSAVVDGGLYGVRLIDALNGYTMDLRSARQLHCISIQPVVGDESQLDCVKISLIQHARRMLSDSKANTLFVSIV